MAGYNEATNQIIVSFRGAVPAINWIDLFIFYKSKTSLCKGCKVHHGLLKNYLSIREQVINGVKALV